MQNMGKKAIDLSKKKGEGPNVQNHGNKEEFFLFSSTFLAKFEKKQGLEQRYLRSSVYFPRSDNLFRMIKKFSI